MQKCSIKTNVVTHNTKIIDIINYVIVQKFYIFSVKIFIPSIKYKKYNIKIISDNAIAFFCFFPSFLLLKYY